MNFKITYIVDKNPIEFETRDLDKMIQLSHRLHCEEIDHKIKFWSDCGQFNKELEYKYGKGK